MNQSFKKRLSDTLRLMWGTPRRLFLNLFRPGYVRASLARRSGKCLRCGVCCRLVYRCLYFYTKDGLPACRLYNIVRPPNCTRFPITSADIADRDLLSPHKPCGYSFAPPRETGELLED